MNLHLSHKSNYSSVDTQIDFSKWHTKPYREVSRWFCVRIFVAHGKSKCKRGVQNDVHIWPTKDLQGAAGFYHKAYLSNQAFKLSRQSTLLMLMTPKRHYYIIQSFDMPQKETDMSNGFPSKHERKAAKVCRRKVEPYSEFTLLKTLKTYAYFPLSFVIYDILKMQSKCHQLYFITA